MSAPIRLPSPVYAIGSVVYLKVNTEYRGVVTGYLVRANNTLQYLVRWAHEDMSEVEHWDMELTAERSFTSE